MSVQIETERKYLIRMPDESRLKAIPGCEIWEIEQIYLSDGSMGETRRIRSVLCKGQYRYFRTEKKRISALSSIEDESEISQETFSALKREADPMLQTIFKRRYRIPYAERKLEFDLYSFWQDRATLEIELSDEAAMPAIPEWIEIIRDVSAEAAYKNRYLAQQIPMEAIDGSDKA